MFICFSSDIKNEINNLSKGKETKLKIQKKWTESKKDDTEYRLNINRMQRLRYQRKKGRLLKEECLEETEICFVEKPI